MRYLVKENTHLKRDGFIDFGWGNGYVILDIDHPHFGKEYDELNGFIEVHYGLTFSEIITEKFIENWEELTHEDLGKWMVGFDTCHWQDNEENWPKWRVEEEAKRLYEQFV